ITYREILRKSPSLLPDHKSSVVVKNEGRKLSKAPTSLQHSQSLKIMLYLGVQSMPPQHKPYEYRSPTQSPHHLHHLDRLQATKSIPQSHHRSSSGSTTPAHHTSPLQQPGQTVRHAQPIINVAPRAKIKQHF
ncbi:unnamed protein product, partial [Heterotrigona itama]